MGYAYFKSYFPIPEKDNTKVREIPQDETTENDTQKCVDMMRWMLPDKQYETTDWEKDKISMSGENTIMYFKDDVGQTFRVVLSPNHGELWDFFEKNKCEFKIIDLQKVVKMKEY